MTVRLGIFLFLFANPNAVFSEDPPDWSSAVETVEWIMELQGHSLRKATLKAWTDSIPADECKGAIEAIRKLDGRQRTWMTAPLLERWGAHDPSGAWSENKWIVEAVSDNHFSDSWSENQIGPSDPELLSRFDHWPDKAEVYAFYSGMRRSGKMGGELNAILRSMEALHLEKFAEELPAPDFRESLSPNLIPLEEVNLLLGCDVEEIPILLKSPSTRNNYAATQFGLRRLALENPITAASIASLYDLPRFQVFSIWADNDPKGLLASLGELSQSEIEMAMGAILSTENEPISTQVSELILESIRNEDQEEQLDYALVFLSRSNPVKAFELFFQWHSNVGLETIVPYEDIVFEAFYTPTSPASLRKMKNLLTSFQISVADDHAYILMEGWGDDDVGEAARFGVEWLLRSESNDHFHADLWRSWPREHLLNVWSGVRDPDDASMDDRTFGALRCWALCQPDEMREWIGTLEDPEVEKALTWLLKNAAGRPGPVVPF